MFVHGVLDTKGVTRMGQAVASWTYLVIGHSFCIRAQKEDSKTVLSFYCNMVQGRTFCFFILRIFVFNT